MNLMSKYDQYKNKAAVFPHKHCPKCNKMVPEEGGQYGEYCSAECAGYYKEKKKKKRLRTIIFIGLYAVAIIVLIVLSFLHK
ncbi:MAG: DUF2116 family Zn-ribbon domain-containing protein [Promethearchaeota archaeon]